MSAQRLMTTGDVARRLGVRRETVYAYVSRGLLPRHASSDRRRSLFDGDAVERLAGRARRPDRSGALEVTVETRLTLLDPRGRLSYRARDVVELARYRRFEQVADLLWGGAAGPWELSDEAADLVAALGRALPDDASAPERIAVTIAGLSSIAREAEPRRPDVVRRTGATILAGALDALPAPVPPARRDAASRLWAALATDPRPPRPAQRAALDAALVLLADHELAASTLAARVAASAWADPYRVVLSGLGPLSGTLHGSASVAVEAMFREIEAAAPRIGVGDAAHAALARRVEAAAGSPGFGHRVYRDRDPRADHLLGRLDAAARDPRRVQTVTAVLAAARDVGLPAPNADLGLCALAYVMALRPGAARTVFTVARIVGMIAHALEEYPHRLRFRPRATYVGPPPG